LAFLGLLYDSYISLLLLFQFASVLDLISAVFLSSYIGTIHASLFS
jgi:hypothetical protein